MSEVKRYEINGTFNVPEIGQKLENPKMVMEADFDRITAERDALQQRLTAADERADVLISALAGMLEYFPEGHSDGECFSVERARAALKPAEGGGDDTTLEEDREDFKKVFVRINTRQGQSISLADMIARYEKKP